MARSAQQVNTKYSKKYTAPKFKEYVQAKLRTYLIFSKLIYKLFVLSSSSISTNYTLDKLFLLLSNQEKLYKYINKNGIAVINIYDYIKYYPKISKC